MIICIETAAQPSAKLIAHNSRMNFSSLLVTITLLPCCRKALLEFIKLFDVDYDAAFSCPICASLDHSQVTLITDGKEMGMNRALSKPYVAPLAAAAESRCAPSQVFHAFLFFAAHWSEHTE